VVRYSFSILMPLILISIFSMSIPFSFTESFIGGLERAYGDDDDDGGDDGGDRGGDDDDDDDGGDDGGGRGGDDGGGRGGDDDDDDGRRESRSFRFNDDSRNLRQLLESLLQQDRDDDDDDNKQELNVEPKSYEGYGLKDEGDNRNKDFNFAVAADFGCLENARNTIKNMEDKKPELVLPLGDLSVDKTANCWLDLISTFDDKSEITFGYHDVKDGESKLNQYKDAFGLDNLYYSFDYRRVHFLIMSTLSDFNVTSDQYKFIEEDLKKTSENENIDWIVVTSYGPFYSSPSAHPAKNDIRNIYHPMFDKYGVDLVLNGHNHNYQRTYPVTFNVDKNSNPIVTNAFTTGYEGNSDGIIYAIVGTGGEGFHPLEGRHSYVATQFADNFGFLNIEISNGNPHTNLTGTFYDNEGSIVRDHFTIKKEIKE
jgi:Calcineurin-like phosphoesterase